MSSVSKNQRPAPSECPVCGADVPPYSRACPECGADERTGWNEEATHYDGLNLPDEDFDNDDPEKTRQQPRAPGRARPNGMPLFWWLFAILMLALLIASSLGVIRFF